MKSFLKTHSYVGQTLYQKMYSDTFDLLSLLTAYVEILDSFNKTFPVPHGHLVQEIADELAIDLSSFDLGKTEQLSQIVKEISQADRSANQKYSELCLKLSKIKNKSQAVFLLQSYISEESFPFYRNLAIEKLKELLAPKIAKIKNQKSKVKNFTSV
jgi:Ni,Fe-hydrogenase I large subunit